MVYCVVPRELADELYDQLAAHYADNDEVTVIIDRRRGDRRGRASQAAPPEAQRRVLRDRRRARVPGDLLPLATP